MSKSPDPSLCPPVATLLARVSLAPRQAAKQLTLWPLIETHEAAPPRAPEYVTLAEAAEAGAVRVEEIGAAGSVPNVLVANRGERAVLVLFGEELRGAKQNRIANASFLVGARSEVVIDVSCVEAGRWAQRGGGGFRTPSSVASHHLRKKMALHVASKLRVGDGFDANQGAVWDEVGYRLEKSGVRSMTSSYSDYLDSRASERRALEGAFRPVPGQVGFVASIGEEVVGLEAIGRPEVFARAMGGLLEGYLIDAVDHALVKERVHAEAAAGAVGAPAFDAPEPFLEALAAVAASSEPFARARAGPAARGRARRGVRSRRGRGGAPDRVPAVASRLALRSGGNLTTPDTAVREPALGARPRLSKTRYVAGLQCAKRLWLLVHGSGAAAPRDAATEAILALGQRVGLRAHALFPGGVLVEDGARRGDEALAETRALLSDASVPAVFEAVFEHEGVRVHVDALERLGGRRLRAPRGEGRDRGEGPLPRRRRGAAVRARGRRPARALRGARARRLRLRARAGGRRPPAPLPARGARQGGGAAETLRPACPARWRSSTGSSRPRRRRTWHPAATATTRCPASSGRTAPRGSPRTGSTGCRAWASASRSSGCSASSASRRSRTTSR